jgi:hypothetical protein
MWLIGFYSPSRNLMVRCSELFSKGQRKPACVGAMQQHTFKVFWSGRLAALSSQSSIRKQRVPFVGGTRTPSESRTSSESANGYLSKEAFAYRKPSCSAYTIGLCSCSRHRFAKYTNVHRHLHSGQYLNGYSKPFSQSSNIQSLNVVVFVVTQGVSREAYEWRKGS